MSASITMWEKKMKKMCIACHKFRQMTFTRQNYFYQNNVLFRATTRCHSTYVDMSNQEIHKHPRIMKIETGKYARFADGAVTARLGDTTVLVTVTGKRLPVKPPFLPMTVDYRHKSAAAGHVPRNLKRRELGPSDLEILTSRVIDRSLRPLFPKESMSEISISCNLFAMDSENDPDVLAINAASAALSLSKIPWNGPIGAVRVGCVDDKFLVNPTRQELKNSSLDLIVAGASHNRIIMLEGSADILPYKKFLEAIMFGLGHTQRIVSRIEDLQKRIGKEKFELDAQTENQDLLEIVSSCAERKLLTIFTEKHDKISRDTAIWKLKGDTKTAVLKEKGISAPDAVLSKEIDEMYDKVFRDTFRSCMLGGKRCDGRKLDEMRELMFGSGFLKPLHGSATFQRGQTQVLCSVTLDSLEMAVEMDMMSQLIKGQKAKNFVLHYEFPSYAVNEMPAKGNVSRREIGHGNLAERGLKPVIPSDYDFMIRLTSEVLESNGSSSMASVCGGYLALKDAGVPLIQETAGVAMGLIKGGKSVITDNQNYVVLTDLLGIEDYIGDMDFKIAGTKEGVTALQADIKIDGLTEDMVSQILRKGEKAIKYLIGRMTNGIRTRIKQEDNLPKIEKLDIPLAQRARFIGPSGLNIKRIERETGVKITSVDETSFNLFAPNKIALTEAKEIIDEYLKKEREVQLVFNSIYKLTVVEVLSGGVKAQINSATPPVFIANSQLGTKKQNWRRKLFLTSLHQVQHGSATGYKVGDELTAVYFGQDPVSGQARFSRQTLIMGNPLLKKPAFRAQNNKNGEKSSTEKSSTDKKKSELER